MDDSEKFESEENLKDDVQESEDLRNSKLSDSSGAGDYVKRAGQIAENAYGKGIMQKESCDFFKGLAANSSIDKTLEEMCKSPFAPPGGKLGMAKDILRQAEDQYNKGASVLELIDEAIKGEYATDADKEFYLGKVIQSPEFVGKVSESERYITEKLEEAKKYKEEHDLLLVNPLIKNGNELQITNSSTVKILDEKKFLKMKPKEKKAYLKECAEHLKKAEKYAEESEKKESKEIDKKYADKLEKFQNENKIIGKHSVKEFKKWMENIDGIETKRDALNELHDNEGGQMERYKKLWNEIRKNLKGEELADIEKMRNANGYTEIFVEYGKYSKTLDDKYEAELDKYVQAGEINEMAKRKFMEDPDSMKNKMDLKTKYHYIDELPNEIKKYKKSHEEIDESEGESGSAIDMSDPLGAVTNLTVKRGIQQTIGDLKSKEEARGLLRIVKSVTRGGQQSDSYDASGFQSSLRKKKEENVEKEEVAENETDDNNVMDFQQALREKREGKKVDKKRSWNPFAKKTQPEQIDEDKPEETEIELSAETRRTSKAVDKSAIKEEVSEMQEIGNAKMVDDRGFLEVQMDEERETMIQINRSEARSRLLFENQRRQYKGRQDGGKDNMTFAVKTEGSQTIELDLTQVRAMEKALEKEKASNLDDVEYRKVS